MKKLIILLSILTILTGCQEKKDNMGDNSKSNTTTSTTTSNMTSEVVNIDDVSTNPTTSTSVIISNEEKTTTVSKTTSTSSTTSKTVTSKTTKKTSSSTTKKTSSTTTTTKTTKTTSVNKLTEKDVYNKMIALKSKYPNGTKYDNSMCYEWKGATATKGCGCAGFAFMLSDAAFGSVKARKHTDISNIRVGDIIRLYNDTHSVIVLEVNSTGVIVAEGNMTIVGSFENGVYWGRKITKDELKSSVNYIYTRW